MLNTRKENREIALKGMREWSRKYIEELIFQELKRSDFWDVYGRLIPEEKDFSK